MKYLQICIIILLLMPIGSALAQEQSEICGPDDIAARADEAIQEYEVARAVANEMEAALDELSRLQTKLDNIDDLCANIASNDPDSTGSGTMQDPYTFGTAGDSGQGFTIQLTGLVRPADQTIRAENMFNDRAGDGEVYIIVEATIHCDENFSGRCETNYFDYELVGDMGTIYEPASVVYDDDLDVGLFAGGEGSGGLVFLVREDDTNLRLLYRANMFDDEFVVFEATPSLANGIQVTAAASLNVRSGPGTNFGVAGNLAADEPVIAFGRNTNGSWLQIPTGWVFAELVTFNGDIQSLPVTAQ